MNSYIADFSKAQSSRNLISNLLFFGLNVISNLVITAFLISRYSIGLYGLIAILLNFSTSFINLLNSLNASSSRYLSIALRDKKFREASEIFNAAIISITLFVLIVSPLVLILRKYAPLVFDIPAGAEDGFVLLIAHVLVQLIFILYQGVFSSSAVSENRIDFHNLSLIVSRLLYFLLILCFGTVFPGKLFYVGLSLVLSSLVGLLAEIFFFKKLTGFIKINFRTNRQAFKMVFSTTFWGLVNNIGSILIIRTGAIIANIGLGSEAAGYFTALYSVSIMLRSLATAFSNILLPKFLQLYAAEEFGKLKTELLNSLKLQAVVVGFLVGILSGLAAPLLRVWLGEEFGYYALHLILIISFLVLDLVNLPLISIHITFNKVKWPGIINIIAGILRVVLAIVFITRTSLGLWGLIISECIVVLLKNICFVIPYNQIVTGISILETFKSISWGIVGYAAIFILSRFLLEISSFSDLVSIMLISVFLGGVYFYLVLRVVFKKSSLLLFLQEFRK